MGRGWRKPEPEVNIQLSRIKRERRHCATPQKTDVTAIFRESAHSERPQNGARPRGGQRSLLQVSTSVGDDD